MNLKVLARILTGITLILTVSLGITAQDATPEAAPAGEAQVTIQEVIDNPDTYVNTPISLSGVVSELVNVRSFLLTEDAALGADSVLVVNNSGQPLPLNLTADERFLVTGMLRSFTRDEGFNQDDWQNDYYDDQQIENLNLYERPLNEYAAYLVVEVMNANNLVPMITLQQLAGGAAPYDDGTVYAIEGYVNEVLTDNSFILGEGAAIANARAIVFGPATNDLTETENDLALADIAPEQFIRVYGTVAQLGGEGFVEDYDTWGEGFGYAYDATYDTTLYGDYEADEWEAVFANLIVPVPVE